jgi:hypothetical protein
MSLSCSSSTMNIIGYVALSQLDVTMTVTTSWASEQRTTSRLEEKCSV